jgi:hypothetical protein
MIYLANAMLPWVDLRRIQLPDREAEECRVRDDQFNAGAVLDWGDSMTDLPPYLLEVKDPR